MAWLRRRRDLGLEPLSELHDEFSAQPNAQSMLDEAEAELEEREQAEEYRHAELQGSHARLSLGAETA